MLKRLTLSIFIFLALSLFSVKTYALSFSVEKDIETKGDWLIHINKLDEVFNSNDNVYRVNLFTSGFEIKEIIINDKFLPIPACNNGGLF